MFQNELQQALDVPVRVAPIRVALDVPVCVAYTFMYKVVCTSLCI